MRKNLFAILVSMLFILSIISINVFAGTEEDPEVKDRIFDVKIFGIFGFPFQMYFKYSDIVSTWFNEDMNNPNYLYISLKIRDLDDKKDDLEAIYDVSWSYSNNYYICCVHNNPNGYGPYFIGISNDGDDNIETWDFCDGIFDFESNIITWKVPKNSVGDPFIGDIITNIYPSSHLRFRDDSDLPHMDLFKDLAWNAKITKDYTVKY